MDFSIIDKWSLLTELFIQIILLLYPFTHILIFYMKSHLHHLSFVVEQTSPSTPPPPILTLKINFSVVSGHEREFKQKIFFLWRLLGLSLEPFFWKGERGYLHNDFVQVGYRNDKTMRKVKYMHIYLIFLTHYYQGKFLPIHLDTCTKSNTYWTSQQIWSDICRLDSDGDGKYNGLELGDPNCEWSTSNRNLSLPAFSHPGILN